MFLLRASVACTVTVAASLAFGQLVDDPDWKESAVPPPPAFNVSKLVPVDVGASSALSFGIDPTTVTLTKEGIVRYVVVASSRTGATNAMYEGVRCASGEFKTYARHNASGGWNLVGQPTWQSLYAPGPSRHTLLLARGGICRGNAPNDNVDQMMRDLRLGPDQKYELQRR